jgi:sugar transferase (PEP-CTERM/EpsH1 system associated)
LRILVLTHRLPFPPDKGERIRAYQWLKALAPKHDVDLLTLADPDVPEDHVHSLKQLVRDVRIIARQPRTSLGLLAWGLLSGKSLTETYFGSDMFSAALCSLLSERDYDICLALCSSMGAHALRARSPKRLMVDLIDVDSAKWRLYAEKSWGLARWVYRRESRKIAELEKALCGRAAVTITVSRQECQLLEQIVPNAQPLALPNSVIVDASDAPAEPQNCITDRLVFVGQMNYYPNVDAVAWFARQVWPYLHARHPRLEWYIVGRDPSREVRRLGRLPNVIVTGTVDDIRPYLASAISIAPLQVSCGIQNKVLEAMAAGRPVIASPAASVGLDIWPQEELLVTDSPKEWLAAVDLLLSDPALASQLGSCGRDAMLKRFSWDRTVAQMLASVEEAKPKAYPDVPQLQAGAVPSLVSASRKRG